MTCFSLVALIALAWLGASLVKTISKARRERMQHVAGIYRDLFKALSE